jgi:transcription initiation factor TFIIH subunit 1
MADLSAADIPEALFRQMTTCQTAGNEFLRQFWAAIYPPASELQTLAAASPAHKAAKADRMADYLLRTPAKVDALVQMARQEGVDAVKVQVVR